MSRKVRHSLIRIAEEGKIFAAVDKYLSHCNRAQNGAEDSPSALQKNLFPNISGFCRFLGVGLSEMEKLKEVHPEDADYILAVMEDEALNSNNAPATLISSYLKYRMDYAKREKLENSSTDCGEVKVVFEHDISEDGA